MHSKRQIALGPSARQDQPRNAQSVKRKWYEMMMAAQERPGADMPPNSAKPLAESRAGRVMRLDHEWFAKPKKVKVSESTGYVIPQTTAAGQRIRWLMKAPGGRGCRDHAVDFPNAMITRKWTRASAWRRMPHVIKPAQMTPRRARARRNSPHRAWRGSLDPKASSMWCPQEILSRVGKSSTKIRWCGKILLHRFDRGRQAVDGQ